MEFIKNLPVFNDFEKIKKIWEKKRNLVLKAPTGSGKSIALPFLLKSSGLVKGRILVVQPRRIAARMLAYQVAKLADWSVGKEVGYHVRMDKKFRDETEIIYVTDGIALSKLLNNDNLQSFEVLILDEFHERSAQLDLCLSLALEKQSVCRLIVTSATLDLEKLSAFVPNSHQLELQGRSFPVQIEYKYFLASIPIWEKVVQALPTLLSEKEGDILVFLDGAYEISKTIRMILRSSWSRGLEVMALYGDLPSEKQDMVLMPSSQRKIIVSTNIAETSLTIEGIKIVVDCGKAKKMSYDRNRAINALLSEPISKSSAEQRAGRAGRISPGYCLRLWSIAEHKNRPKFDVPEIRRIDLCQIYLNLLNAGRRLQDIMLLDPVEIGAIEEAEVKLKKLGAIDSEGSITPLGAKMGKLPIDPTWSHALIVAKKKNIAPTVALLLAMLEDRPPVQSEVLGDFFPLRNPRSDAYCILLAFEEAAKRNFDVQSCDKMGIHAGRCSYAAELARTYCNLIDIPYNVKIPNYEKLADALIACFPHAIAHLVSEGRRIYQDSLGRRLHLTKRSVVGREKFILPLRIMEKKIKGSMILEVDWASGLDESWIRKNLGNQISISSEVALDLSSRKVVKTTSEGICKFTLKSSLTEEVSKEEQASAYAKALMNGDLKLKNWNAQVEKLLDRKTFLNHNFPEFGIVAFDDETKRLFFEQLCLSATTWKEIKNFEILKPLLNCFSEEEIELLNQAVPETFDMLNGKRPYSIDYSQKHEAVLRIILQDLYDIQTHPTIVFGKCPIVVEILAPNRRPVQRTSNLTSFWQGAYPMVRKELAGRYPKHEWR